MPTVAALHRGPDKIGPLHWTALSRRVGVSAVVVPVLKLDPVWQFPVIGAVYASDNAPIWTWVWREGDLGREDIPHDQTGPARLALSVRVRKALSRISPLAESALLTIQFPESSIFSLLPALGSEVAEGAIVHIASEAVTHRGGEWRLLVFDGICAPVQCMPSRGLKPGELRCGMLLRAVVGATADSRVQLMKLPTGSRLSAAMKSIGRDESEASESSIGRRVLHGLEFIVRTIRWCDYAIELLLRSVLRAPVLVLRTTQAPVGDDVSNTIRLHSSVFASLGLSPGMQVLVTWCGLQVAANALEDYEAYDEETLKLLRERQAVGVTRLAPPDDLPPHVVGRLSLGVRRQLGIPPDTVVEVRRRLRPLVMSHANQLTIPIAGVLLTGLAVPHIRWWELAIVVVVVVILSLTPLRRSRPPRDVWPGG